MKGDNSLFRHAKHPYLAFLVGAVAGGLVLGGGYLLKILRTDPTMVLVNKKENEHFQQIRGEGSSKVLRFG
jgi:hypothetical protein